MSRCEEEDGWSESKSELVSTTCKTYHEAWKQIKEGTMRMLKKKKKDMILWCAIMVLADHLLAWQFKIAPPW